jgi:glucosylceramidase
MLKLASCVGVALIGAAVGLAQERVGEEPSRPPGRDQRPVVVPPTVRWLATTADKPWDERKIEASTTGEIDLELTGTRHQAMEGFGGCFNEAGWKALSALTPGERQPVMKALFDPEEGCGFNLCRLPIGASDYALEWYSLDETAGDLEMKQFSIDRDKQFLVPYVKAALAYRPDLLFFASPWSPPTWMKTPPAYNGGVLTWEKPTRQAYARYLLQFVKAYAAEGIRIRQLHVQNEPDSNQKFPSCLWTGEKLRDFIREDLGPLFASEAPGTEVWAGTLERPDVNAWANVILGDAEARKYVAGVGYQWGGRGAVARTRESWPKLRMLETENECGDGQNTWDYAFYVAGLMKDYITSGVAGYIYWNMILPTGGESTWGWRQNSMISIDPATKSITYNPEFYAMKHLSRFVAPNAVLLGVSNSWAPNALLFENASTEKVLFIFNPQKEARTLTFAEGKARFHLTLEARSFNTLIWNPGLWTKPTKGKGKPPEKESEKGKDRPGGHE